MDDLNGAKGYLGKVKPQDNAGRQSSDSGGLGWPCKFSWGVKPVACLHLSATVQLFA